MKELTTDQPPPDLAKKLGLTLINEEKGIYHLTVTSGLNNEAMLNKMSEIENSGFLYQGISKIIGKGAFMVFSAEII